MSDCEYKYITVYNFISSVSETLGTYVLVYLLVLILLTKRKNEQYRKYIFIVESLKKKGKTCRHITADIIFYVT